MKFSNYKLRKLKSKAFTMIEVIIVTVIVSTGIIGIISVVNYGTRFSERTRSQVVAINLARQGIEGVLNIRDTNWKRWSGRRDECWLLSNPSLDGSECETKDWIMSGNYIMSGNTTTNGQKYYYLSGKIDKELNIANGIDSDDRAYALCHDQKWEPCPGDDNPTPEGRFFRKINIKGLYDKNDNEEITCDKGDDSYTSDGNNYDCGSNRAKELRFCSKVEYLSNGVGQVNLCSIITNFKR